MVFVQTYFTSPEQWYIAPISASACTALAIECYRLPQPGNLRSSHFLFSAISGKAKGFNPVNASFSP